MAKEVEEGFKVLGASINEEGSGGIDGTAPACITWQGKKDMMSHQSPRSAVNSL